MNINKWRERRNNDIYGKEEKNSCREDRYL